MEHTPTFTFPISSSREARLIFLETSRSPEKPKAEIVPADISEGDVQKIQKANLNAKGAQNELDNYRGSSEKDLDESLRKDLPGDGSEVTNANEANDELNQAEYSEESWKVSNLAIKSYEAGCRQRGVDPYKGKYIDSGFYKKFAGIVIKPNEGMSEDVANLAQEYFIQEVEKRSGIAKAEVKQEEVKRTNPKKKTEAPTETILGGKQTYSSYEISGGEVINAQKKTEGFGGKEYQARVEKIDERLRPTVESIVAKIEALGGGVKRGADAVRVYIIIEEGVSQLRGTDKSAVAIAVRGEKEEYADSYSNAASVLRGAGEKRTLEGAKSYIDRVTGGSGKTAKATRKKKRRLFGRN